MSHPPLQNPSPGYATHTDPRPPPFCTQAWGMFVWQGASLDKGDSAPAGRGAGLGGGAGGPPEPKWQSAQAPPEHHWHKRQRRSGSPVSGTEAGHRRGGVAVGQRGAPRDPSPGGVGTGAGGVQIFSADEPGSESEASESEGEGSWSDESGGGRGGGLGSLLSSPSESDDTQDEVGFDSSFVCVCCLKVRYFETDDRPDSRTHKCCLCRDCEEPCRGPLHDRSAGGDEDKWARCSCQAHGRLRRSLISRSTLMHDGEVWVQPPQQD